MLSRDFEKVIIVSISFEISRWAGPVQLFLLSCVERIVSVYTM